MDASRLPTELVGIRSDSVAFRSQSSRRLGSPLQLTDGAPEPLAHAVGVRQLIVGCKGRLDRLGFVGVERRKPGYP